MTLLCCAAVQSILDHLSAGGIYAASERPPPLLTNVDCRESVAGERAPRCPCSADARFNRKYNQMLMRYDIAVGKTLLRPVATVMGVLGIFLISLALYPLLGVSFFPRTDPGQFMINLKAPSGTRLELTDQYMLRAEQDIRQVVAPRDLGMVLSNIGVTPGFSSMYTSNSGQHTATIQVSLKEGHRVGSYQYMDRVRRKLLEDMPELT